MFCQQMFTKLLTIHSCFIERTPMRGGKAPLRPNVTLTRRSKKAEEPVVLTLSSDEEDDADTSNSKVRNAFIC